LGIDFILFHTSKASGADRVFFGVRQEEDAI
jgi:hypothetical protein